MRVSFGVELSAEHHEKLLGYLALLIKWNKAYNLTAVRDPDEMVSRHLLDSLSVMSFIHSERENWLDVGSGGGMPGIPLAILHPHKRVTVLDANGKKTRFLTQVKMELKLDNLTVIHSRVEAYQPGSAVRRNHLPRLQQHGELHQLDPPSGRHRDAMACNEGAASCR